MGFEGAVVAEKIKLPTNTRFLFSLHFTKKHFVVLINPFILQTLKYHQLKNKN